MQDEIDSDGRRESDEKVEDNDLRHPSPVPDSSFPCAGGDRNRNGQLSEYAKNRLEGRESHSGAETGISCEYPVLHRQLV